MKKIIFYDTSATLNKDCYKPPWENFCFEHEFPHRQHRSRKNRKKYSCHRSMQIKNKLFAIKGKEILAE